MRALSSPAALAAGEGTTWLRAGIAVRNHVPGLIGEDEVAAAAARMERFAPLLATLFSGAQWDGRVRSDLIDYPGSDGQWLVKGDHALPMTGSIKARGGVHELLCFIEDIALRHQLLSDDVTALAGPAARAVFARHRVVVASTGNLGYSIGLVGRALGLATEIHMSHEAKAWKKERLRELGATVVEHPGDYSDTVAAARQSALGQPDTAFIDDERSRHLLTGYAAAADEIAGQLQAKGLSPSVEHPIVVYLPCGVGGAPGGITLGLKRRFGAGVICVFVEPVASACMLLALMEGEGQAPSVYDYGCDNETIADGLAVPRASELVLAAVGNAIDAVVAVPDEAMVAWMRKVWTEAGLRLEPSAAAAFAARDYLIDAATGAPGWPALDCATHLFWATGGSRLPDSEFSPLIGQDEAC